VTPSAPPSPAVGPLLAALARLAAAAPSSDRLVPAALEQLRQAVGARRCGVWGADAPGGPPRWVAGDGPDHVDPRAASRPLVAGGVEVGRLAVEGTDAAPDAELLDPVADLLATVVHHADEAARARQAAVARAEEADAERRFVGEVIDALPLGVYVTDREHRVRLWNRKREVGTLGIAREAAVGREIFAVMPRQDAALMRAELDDVLATGEPQQIETESRSMGAPRTYRLRKLPMAIAGGGAPTHVITVGEDVTEWKDALGRTAQAEKLAAVGQLAAGVMHEINNPLGTIAACAETMSLALAELPPNVPRPAGFGEYLRIIDHEVHRCRRIAEGLLNFSRAKAVERARLELDDVVERTLTLLKHHTRFRRCPVRLDFSSTAATGAGQAVWGDPDQLVQVLMVLLLNAADAVAEAPARDAHEAPRGVTVRTRSGDPGEAVLEIEDEGVGIAADARDKLFEPFYTTKAPGQGTGLGLSIAYGIVRDLGGRLEVDSVPGQGSRFRVVLPAA
jgi:two-component system NtrC family sensor kinase